MGDIIQGLGGGNGCAGLESLTGEGQKPLGCSVHGTAQLPCPVQDALRHARGNHFADFIPKKPGWRVNSQRFLRCLQGTLGSGPGGGVDDGAAGGDALSDAAGNLIAQIAPIAAGKGAPDRPGAESRRLRHQIISRIHPLGCAGRNGIAQRKGGGTGGFPRAQGRIDPGLAGRMDAGQSGTQSRGKTGSPICPRLTELSGAGTCQRNRAGNHGVHGAQHPGLLLPKGGGQVRDALSRLVHGRK